MTPMQVEVRDALLALVANKRAEIARADVGWDWRWKLEDEISGAIQLARRLRCFTGAEAERIRSGGEL